MGRPPASWRGLKSNCRAASRPAAPADPGKDHENIGYCVPRNALTYHHGPRPTSDCRIPAAPPGHLRRRKPANPPGRKRKGIFRGTRAFAVWNNAWAAPFFPAKPVAPPRTPRNIRSEGRKRSAEMGVCPERGSRFQRPNGNGGYYGKHPTLAPAARPGTMAGLKVAARWRLASPFSLPQAVQGC